MVNDMIGRSLTCGIHGDRCPFNWDLLVEGAEMIGYVDPSQREDNRLTTGGGRNERQR